ncbi:class I SAM-dependent methyltransferase [Gryllotalpicola daejeonensis]|uniref:Class I SAM-dependent methyltransferase n=1 Tax=Gryllotalpicola daejeonensis TaxID=993087 RepID=A0ABP7ZET3_9MICO
MSEAADFDAARAETVRYHREFYASADIGTPGSWLAKPHRLVLDALDLVDQTRPVIAYDLGAGVGRHTIPIVERVHSGSTVIAVDLLPDALERLKSHLPASPQIEVQTVAADLADYQFDEPADLVVAFSAIEHLPDLDTIAALLARIARATAPGGVVAIGIIGDRREVTTDGEERPALLESGITSDQASALLSGAFTDFTVMQQWSAPATVKERRDGQEYVLTSTLVTFLAQRPA